MKLHQLFNLLEKSKAYKAFRSHEHTKHAFFCAGFLIINFKHNIYEYSLDFRNEKEIFSFKIAEMSDVIMQKESLMSGRQPLEKVDEKELHNLKIDIEDLRNLAEKEFKHRNIEKNLEEIIAVLQYVENKLVWHLTCVASGFTIISIIFDAETGESIKFEKKNIMDFVSVKKPGEIKPEEKKS